MLIQSGIYKDNNTDTPDYRGCSDNFYFDESVIVENEEIGVAIDSYLPESLKNTDFEVFSVLMRKQASQIDGYSNFIIECYNLDNIDEDMVYKISSIYNIEYPFDYDINRLKLLIKNYEIIRRERGIEKSIYMLFRILERSEEDLYEDDQDDTVVTKIDDGYYRIFNTRINNLDFANYMLKKVVRTGIYFEIVQNT